MDIFSRLRFVFLLATLTLTPSIVLADEKPDLSALSMVELINGFYSNVSCGPGGAMESPYSTDDQVFFNTYKKCIKLNYHYLKAIAKLAPAYYEAYKQVESDPWIIADLASIKKAFDEVGQGEAAWDAFFASANTFDYDVLTDKQHELLGEALIHLLGAPYAVGELNGGLNITDPDPMLD
ncbi:hypothetical protein DU002_18260 [Corallincola holothuriorum]|uniref:Uncharacterized protein n=1 Tax=Corallincola holothuriorum TaxID=2282215 RepID=A0A368N2S5_9GAMM|nr:hypothetical protein [Corallincola holothuriorum]RCU43825.1 hypothetical protein DU002_18260 [Corallincola holothuriorum]